MGEEVEKGRVSSKRKVIRVGDSMAVTLPKKWLDFQKWLGEEVTELHTLADDAIILVRPGDEKKAEKILDMLEESDQHPSSGVRGKEVSRS